MPDILASVSVLLGADISGFRAAMAEARRELRGFVQFSEGMRDVGKNLTTYVSAPLALLGTVSVVAAAKIDSLQRGLNAITTAELAKNGTAGLNAVQQASQQTGERLLELQAIAKAPGIGFEQAVQGDIRLRSVGITAANSAKALKEFANAIATTGGGASEFDRVTTQLAQLSAKGKVLSQDLRPIIEAAPAVSQALLKLYGTIDSETISASLAKQGKSSQDFIAVLTDELAKLPRVTGGLANSFENLQQTAVQSAAKLGDGISRALNIPALTEGLSNGIERLGSAFANLTPGVQRTIVILAGIAAATGPVLVAVGTLGAALPAITAGFATLGVTSLAALGPILPIAAAVAAAAYLIYDNFDELSAYLGSGEVAALFSDMASAAGAAADAIGEAFSTLRANAGDNLGDIISVADVFRDIFREAAVGITAALNVVSGVIKAVNSLLTGEFSQALDGAKQATTGLIAPLANLFGYGKKDPTDSGIYVLAQQAKEFNAVGPQLAANLALLNNVRLGTLADDAGAAAKQIGLLKKLEDELKAAKETKPDLTTRAEIADRNILIASLEKQIAALNALGIGSKKANDAFAKLRAELAALGELDDILARPADGLDRTARRVQALESGLKNLLTAGVSPSSAAFRAFANEALSLQRGLAGLQASSNLSFSVITELKLGNTNADKYGAETAAILGAEFANRPVNIPYRLTPIKTDFSGDILNTTLDIQRGLAEAANSAVAFGGSFDQAGARVEVLRNGLQNLLKTGISPVAPAVQQLSSELANAATLYDLNTAATNALGSGLASLGTGLLEGLGQLAAGNATLGQFGATVLGLVGKLATQLGEAIVAVGIGMLNLKTAFTNSFSAIAAGAALIVVGAALGSISSSLGSVGTSSGGGAGGGSSPATANYGQGATQATVKVIAEFKLRGKDLVAVGRSDQYRSEKVNG